MKLPSCSKGILPFEVSASRNDDRRELVIGIGVGHSILRGLGTMGIHGRTAKNFSHI